MFNLKRDRRPELRYVFVMTYGRSGSTLMMGILNSIPGWCLRGENRHALRHLYEYHRTCVTEQERVPAKKAARRTHPWFGIGRFDREASYAGTRRLVLESLLRPKEDTRVTGFKEIRWYDGDLAEYVAWMQQVFPGARFVVNTRNLDDVARSGWWAQEDDARARLQVIEDRMLAVAEGLGDAAYRVHYDDFKDDPAALRGLFEWLGESWDEEQVAATMEREYSVRYRKQPGAAEA